MPAEDNQNGSSVGVDSPGSSFFSSINLYSFIPAKEPESDNMSLINKISDQVKREIRRFLYKAHEQAF
jgi:hypothetical protein